MPKTKLYPDNFYMNPYKAIQRLKCLFNNYGFEYVVKEQKFKAEREAWITAAFSLALTKLTEEEYWVGINREDDTPDSCVVSFKTYEKNHNIREIREIEIFVWEKHSKLSLFEALKKKLKEKAYPKHFILLCYVYDRVGEKLELEEIFSMLEKEKINIAQIWLLSSIKNDKNNHTLVQLFPERIQIDFNLEEEIEKHKNQKEMIKVRRGKGEKFKPLGKFYLPLPGP